MPCHTCSASFGFFKRERCCKNCGFSFCKSCLKKAKIPKLGNKPHSVCKKCILSLAVAADCLVPPTPSPQPSPPAILAKRVQAHDNSDSPFDKQLTGRLQKLKGESPIPVPTESEIKDRLSKLRGVKSLAQDGSTMKPPLMSTMSCPAKTQFEQTADLIKQVQEEVAIDQKRPKPEDEIAERLARVRASEPCTSNGEPVVNGDTPKPKPAIPSSPKPSLKKLITQSEENGGGARAPDSGGISELNCDEMFREALAAVQKRDSKVDYSDEDDDEEVRRVADQLIEEAKLEREEEEGALANGEGEQELPWCAICSADAKIICNGCEGERYCKVCFRECHAEDEEMRSHRFNTVNPASRRLGAHDKKN